MRLSTKHLRCPRCKDLLVGLVRKVAVDFPVPTSRENEQTEWFCESCDTEWVLMWDRGLTEANEAERLLDEREDDEDY
jgi:hypothetical protein